MRMIISLFNLLVKIYRTFIFVVIECVCIKFGNNQLFSLKIYILYIYTCQLFAILKISNLELFSDFPPPPSSNDFINQIQSCNWDKYILRPVISMLFLFQSMVVWWWWWLLIKMIVLIIINSVLNVWWINYWWLLSYCSVGEFGLVLLSSPPSDFDKHEIGQSREDDETTIFHFIW